MKYEDLIGKREFSGIEKGPDYILVELDGKTYRFSEDPDDGYRSYCSAPGICFTPPRYRFQPVPVDITVRRGKYFVGITAKDPYNGKIIFKIGTDYTEQYYPFCLFSYSPENMEVNACRES